MITRLIQCHLIHSGEVQYLAYVSLKREYLSVRDSPFGTVLQSGDAPRPILFTHTEILHVRMRNFSERILWSAHNIPTQFRQHIVPNPDSFLTRSCGNCMGVGSTISALAAQLALGTTSSRLPICVHWHPRLEHWSTKKAARESCTTLIHLSSSVLLQTYWCASSRNEWTSPPNNSQSVLTLQYQRVLSLFIRMWKDIAKEFLSHHAPCENH